MNLSLKESEMHYHITALIILGIITFIILGNMLAEVIQTDGKPFP